jgi:hypothetical protein
MALTGIGRAQLAKARPEAVATLERAVAALQKAAPTDQARALELLAHALRAAGREPAAVASARKALELYRSANRLGDAATIKALEAFLDRP